MGSQALRGQKLDLLGLVGMEAIHIRGERLDLLGLVWFGWVGLVWDEFGFRVGLGWDERSVELSWYAAA